MHTAYEDITSKLGLPLWYDEYAVPRYVPFHPKHLANIYARTAALVEIACQSCGHRFPVAISQDTMGEVHYRPWSLREKILSGSLHYGDPPNLPCCPAGPSMSCEDLHVLEFWYRERAEWIRDPALELALGSFPADPVQSNGVV